MLYVWFGLVTIITVHVFFSKDGQMDLTQYRQRAEKLPKDASYSSRFAKKSSFYVKKQQVCHF